MVRWRAVHRIRRGKAGVRMTVGVFTHRKCCAGQERVRRRHGLGLAVASLVCLFALLVWCQHSDRERLVPLDVHLHEVHRRAEVVVQQVRAHRSSAGGRKQPVRVLSA